MHCSRQGHNEEPCIPAVRLFLHTFSVCMVAPLKATGASSVGGNPAWDPAAATRLLQLMRKLIRVKVCGPSTHTTDSGLWSRDTVGPSLWLNKWSRNLLWFNEVSVTNIQTADWQCTEGYNCIVRLSGFLILSSIPISFSQEKSQSSESPSSQSTSSFSSEHLWSMVFLESAPPQICSWSSKYTHLLLHFLHLVLLPLLCCQVLLLFAFSPFLH